VSIDLAGLDEIFTDFDSSPFLIYNSAWNKICTDLPLSIIFINSITNYLPVNVQLIINFCFCSFVSGHQFMGFHSFAGLWAVDSYSHLGSSSRSPCPCLNFFTTQRHMCKIEHHSHKHSKALFFSIQNKKTWWSVHGNKEKHSIHIGLLEMNWFTWSILFTVPWC
jgi:hypothetical protein